MDYTFNPFTSRLDAVRPSSHWQQLVTDAQSTSGAGVGMFQLTDIPFNSAIFIQYVLVGKLVGGNEFYIELVTKRLYRGATGNLIELSGATTSLSENFTINPNRAQSLGAGTYSLTVSSGGAQTVDWTCYVDYLVTDFN